ncbi:MAG: hypothetical protein ACKN9U_04060, partial [Pirellulaceae bacterium]
MHSFGYVLQFPIASRFTTGAFACLLVWGTISFALAEEPISPPAPPPDMQVLFDGKSLEGW